MSAGTWLQLLETGLFHCYLAQCQASPLGGLAELRLCSYSCCLGSNFTASKIWQLRQGVAHLPPSP
jgi:hypothetical protein